MLNNSNYLIWFKLLIYSFQYENINAEFLKAATMKSHNCAESLSMCANYGLIKAKHKKVALISCICHNLTNNLVLHVLFNF